LDENELTVGDSLSRKIDEGLAHSSYGIVILSENFFRKPWPRHELAGLTARQIGGTKVILPVWHKVNRDYIRQYSPTLADVLGAITEHGLPDVAAELARAIRAVQGSATGTITVPPPISGPTPTPKTGMPLKRRILFGAFATALISGAIMMVWAIAMGDMPASVALELRLLIGGFELRVFNEGHHEAQEIIVDAMAWQVGAPGPEFRNTYKVRDLNSQSDLTIEKVFGDPPGQMKNMALYSGGPSTRRFRDILRFHGKGRRDRAPGRFTCHAEVTTSPTMNLKRAAIWRRDILVRQIRGRLLNSAIPATNRELVNAWIFLQVSVVPIHTLGDQNR
jgi:hypothetical protein